MKRPSKSHKITSKKKVVKKPSRFIEGEEYVLVLTEILNHRPVFQVPNIPEQDTSADAADDKLKEPPIITILPNNKKAHQKKLRVLPHLRLWLKIIPDCVETDLCYFTQEPKGEKKVADAVSAYIPFLTQTHPLFSDSTQKFTNTSLRKFHNDALSKAGAPIIVQQESLAQNTKAYAKKRLI